MKKIYTFTFNLSAWYVLLLCCLFVLASYHLLNLYSTVHWQTLRSSYKLHFSIEKIETIEPKESEDGNEILDELSKIETSLSESSFELMKGTSLYHFTGLLAFTLALFTFFARPRWVGIIALPIGIYGLHLSSIIM